MVISPLSPLAASGLSPASGTPAAPAAAESDAADAAFASAMERVSFGHGSKSGELEPLQKFEGFVLRTFVEAMLPKENESFFGKGTAGDIWRSMLAERIGDEIAASGGVGIAEMLAKDDALGSEAEKAGEALADDGLAGGLAQATADGR